MSFGKWLSSRREDARLTQQEVADRVGISFSYVSALERDVPNSRDGSPRRLRASKVEKLAKVLGVDVNEARLAAGYNPVSSGVLSLSARGEFSFESRANLQNDDSVPLDVDPELQVSLVHGKDLDEQAKHELEMTIRGAYETWKGITMARKRTMTVNATVIHPDGTWTGPKPDDATLMEVMRRNQQTNKTEYPHEDHSTFVPIEDVAILQPTIENEEQPRKRKRRAG